MNVPRPSHSGEEDLLKMLWREVFADSDQYIDTFFQAVYKPGMASVIYEDEKIVAAAYAIPFGSAQYIYAVSTLPNYRGRGYGKAVTLAAAEGKPAYLCPASAGLRCWYALSMNAKTVSYRAAIRRPAFLSKITADEYCARREDWLHDVPHAQYSPGILKLFSVTGKFYCGDHGDIYAIDGGIVREAIPSPVGEEPFIMGLNGAKPIYWGIALE